ncbi:MAG: hypothetical protein IPJ52_14030 [Rhodocyclaceae bacterium]|nr:hypothetical protein [Rhodocyclaceae bacterium]
MPARTPSALATANTSGVIPITATTTSVPAKRGPPKILYWKRYRDENPAYVERNRNLQQQRNQKQRTTVIANEDVSHPLTTPPSGRYRMAQILEDGAIGGQTWIVEITALKMAQADEDV